MIGISEVVGATRLIADLYDRVARRELNKEALQRLPRVECKTNVDLLEAASRETIQSEMTAEEIFVIINRVELEAIGELLFAEEKSRK